MPPKSCKSSTEETSGGVESSEAVLLNAQATSCDDLCCRLELITDGDVGIGVSAVDFGDGPDAEVGGSSDFLRYHVRKQVRAGAKAPGASVPLGE